MEVSVIGRVSVGELTQNDNMDVVLVGYSKSGGVVASIGLLFRSENFGSRGIK